tara:strand:+ start:8697 stop:10085 length:1389 start_codon:yes stop_codon:yes gene_type:complete
MERERHIKNLKLISSLAKNKKNTLKQKKNLGTNLIKAIQGVGCEPNKILYYHEKTEPSFFSIEDSLSIKRGTKQVGTGKFGRVYMGCLDKECTKKIAIKIIIRGYLEHEYKIAKRIENLGGIKPFHYEKCDETSFLYTEYANSGTLREFIKKNRTNLLPIHFRTIITQVLYNLYRIQKKYPTFRHNDLHLENVLINTSRPSRIKLLKVDNTQLRVHDIGLHALISDFGLSTMKNIKSPIVDKDPIWYKTESGIYRNSHPMYDTHSFLNTLRSEIKNNGVKSGVEALQFIERILPLEYIGKISSKVYDWRLRASPLGHPNIPSFKQIFNDRYFSPYKKTVIPFDINTIIKPQLPSKPKPILVKHGGEPIKKSLNQIRKELASKNNKKVLKRPSIRFKPKINIPFFKNKVKVSVANKGYIKLDNRKCVSYKKSELIKKAQSLGIKTDNKTIKRICEDIKLKYTK